MGIFIFKFVKSSEKFNENKSFDLKDWTEFLQLMQAELVNHEKDG